MWGDDEVKFYSPGTKHNAKLETVVSEERDQTSGQLVRVTRELKVTLQRVKINKNVRHRRGLPKFGACADLGQGPDHCTSIDYNVIELDLNPNPKPEVAEAAAAALPLAPILVVCQLCKEPGHWTLKCPKRNEEGPRTMPGRRKEELRGEEQLKFSVCISNVPPHMQELDVLDLCPRSFRRHVVRSRDADADAEALRAFVDFRSQDDADAAVARLNGLLYGNMVLSVQRAKPRKSK